MSKKDYRENKKLLGYWTSLEDYRDMVEIKEYMGISTMSNLLRFIVCDWCRIRLESYRNYIQRQMLGEMEDIFDDKSGDLCERIDKLLHLDNEIKDIENKKNKG